MSDGLEACPWCGPKAPVGDGDGKGLSMLGTYSEHRKAFRRPYYVRCCLCGAQGPVGSARHAAARAWNARALAGPPIKTQRLWDLVEDLGREARRRKRGSTADQLYAAGLHSGVMQLRAALEGK